MLASITTNSFLMAFTFWIGWLAGIKSRGKYNPLYVLIAWLAMEYATNNFWLFSPWLNLGNALARNTGMIQWYEFTGVAGGTLWILTVNMLIASTLTRISEPRNTSLSIIRLTAISAVIAAPLILSLRLLNKQSTLPASGTTVILVQPNVDPYSEKFSTPFTVQLNSALTLVANAKTEEADWIIAPETTIDDPINLDSTHNNMYINKITCYLSGHMHSMLVIGATTSSGTGNRKFHNSALGISSQGIESVYHKSRLVPGIERPFGRSLKFMQRLFPYLGGTGAGFHGQTSRPVMKHHHTGISLAPVICFESAFPEHVASFVRNGADIIAVITNDGWWNGTYGYQQHLSFSCLRAIETRRPVVRAANTGVSAYIDHSGQIISTIPWWTEGTLLAEPRIPGKVTFFVRNGDLIGRSSATLMIFIAVLSFIAVPLRKRLEQKNTV